MRAALTWAFALAAATAANAQPAGPQLADWSGVWELIGGTVFDAATVEPRDGRSGDPGVREHPPLNAEWEARYRANIEAVRAGRFPDPLTYCGIPAGFPRLMNVPDVYEFVVRPEQVWILTENGPNILRIYTDGRAHPAEGDYWPTYTGDSIGRWEADTLIVDTIGLKGEGTILDRTGLVLSGAEHVVTRLRKIDAETLEAQMTIDDKDALTAPWRVVKRYRKLPPGSRVYDYACAENNRNPVDDDGRTLTLGADGAPIDTNAR